MTRLRRAVTIGERAAAQRTTAADTGVADALSAQQSPSCCVPVPGVASPAAAVCGTESDTRRHGTITLGALRRMAGIGERTDRAAIRREILIQNIDYNPKTLQFADAHVNTANFFNGLRNRVNDLPALAGYRNQLTNVAGDIGPMDFRAPDVDQLTAAIVKALRDAYSARGLTGWPAPVHNGFTISVRGALLAGLTTPTQMDPAEQGAFDQLANLTGAAGMSRAKGTTSTIPFAMLPGAVAAEVMQCRDDLTNERRRWGKQTFPYQSLDADVLGGEVAEHLQTRGRYQGNHTNYAGWLPVVPIPPSPLSAIRQHVQQNADPILAAALGANNAQRVINNDSALKQRYDALYATASNGVTDAAMRDAAIATLGLGVSVYIEFWLSATPVSRLVYDYVNKRFYVTVHYRWKDGYNPFFLVTGVPAP